jgi:hypothetical protein
MGVSSQNTPLHNILATQPIYTNNNSIDAPRQAQYEIKFKNVKIRSRGQFSRKFPQREFPSQKI